MKPEVGKVEIDVSGGFIHFGDGIPVFGDIAVFDVINGCKEVIKDNVVLRGDKTCFGVKDKGNIAGMLR